MAENEIWGKTILRRYRRIDPWFIAKAGLNLYRGCAHDCAYCDGRAEKYQVTGDFAHEVAVKSNALEVLRRELQVRRHRERPANEGQGELWPQQDPIGGPQIRAEIANGFVMMGGGVGDSYQAIEARRSAARGVLELFESAAVPVHILTKSALVLRDIDLIERINRKAGALVSFSISTSMDSLALELEPGAPPPSERLAALARLRRSGLPGGVFLLPVVPFISDSPEMIDASVCAAIDAGAQYVVFGGMTLKSGRQREHFLDVLARTRPGLPEKIASLYPIAGPQAKWGQAFPNYYGRIRGIFNECVRRRRVPPRIPRRLFPDIVFGPDLVAVLLEHISVLLAIEGRPSPYGREAARIARISSPLQLGSYEGPAASEVREILATGLTVFTRG